MIDELVVASSTNELKLGFIFDNKKDSYMCLICGNLFKNGEIFKVQERLCDSKLAVQEHIKHSHGSYLDYLIKLGKERNGLSDTQKEIIELIINGFSDSDIAKSLNKADSTIRNHRYNLREKYKEAKIFIVIMELFEELIDSKSKLVQYHSHIPIKDDRIIVTQEESEKIIQKYFQGDKLTKFPKKEKLKLVLLKKIIENFDVKIHYREKDVNDILKMIYTDYVTIRRYLIEYGFMDRTPDCKEYWIKQD